MSKLVEAMQEKAARRRSEAGATYREILSRADQPQPHDQNALEGVLGILGRTTQDLAEDIELVGRLRVAEQLANGHAQHQAELQAAHEQLAEILKWAQQQRDALESKISKRQDAAEATRKRAQSLATESQAARAELASLRDEWEAILEGQSAEDVRDKRIKAARTGAPHGADGRARSR